MNESVEELKRLHLLAKPELKQALINIENIIKNDDGEAALFAIEHLSDAIKSHDHVEDILFATIESQKSEIEGYKANTELAVKGLEYYTGTEHAEIVRRYYFGETQFDGLGQRARVVLDQIKGLSHDQT